METEKYFMYSKEQHDTRTKIEAKIGRVYIPGVVVIAGEERLFTEISDRFNDRLKDVITVYQGDPSDVRYTKPKTIRKAQ